MEDGDGFVVVDDDRVVVGDFVDDDEVVDDDVGVLVGDGGGGGVVVDDGSWVGLLVAVGDCVSSLVVDELEDVGGWYHHPPQRQRPQSRSSD